LSTACEYLTPAWHPLPPARDAHHRLPGTRSGPQQLRQGRARSFSCRGEGGDLLSDTVCTRTWEKARRGALRPTEAASPLAERPYDLRHARLSTWLNAGVAPAQVAEWAGNSVPVLLRVYAKCLTDSEQTALRRIEEAEARPDKDPQAE
jgi:hypothetical protein